MKRRERLMGIAEKMPKNRPTESAQRRKIVLLDSRRSRKRR